MRDDDQELKALFDHAAGSQPPVDRALSDVRPRIRRAQQRRLVVRGSAGVLGLVVVGGMVTRGARPIPKPSKVASTGWVVAPPAGTDVAISPETVASGSTASMAPAAPPVTAPTSVALSTRLGATAPSLAVTSPTPPPTTIGLAPAGPTSVLEQTVPESEPSATSGSTSTTSSSSTISSSSTTASSSSSSSIAPSTTVAESQATFSCPGGTVRVGYTATAMTLLGATPASGWTVGTTRLQPDDIEVQFRRGGEDPSGVHLRLVNGIPLQTHFDD